jgi:hypothetical protein
MVGIVTVCSKAILLVVVGVAGHSLIGVDLFDVCVAAYLGGVVKVL